MSLERWLKDFVALGVSKEVKMMVLTERQKGSSKSIEITWTHVAWNVYVPRSETDISRLRVALKMP